MSEIITIDGLKYRKETMNLSFNRDEMENCSVGFRVNEVLISKIWRDYIVTVILPLDATRKTGFASVEVME